MVGYLFLGAAYGILMKVNGYGIGWSFAISLLVYAGSLQYLGITLLAGLVHPLYAFAMGLMLNARHLFYGISMLSKYRDVKKYKPYLIFALTDETFSVVCQEMPPEHLDRDLVYFWITLLDQCYWVLGSLLGAVLGSMIAFDTTGLDFALTALFVVIFVDQWKSQKDHNPALLGLGASVLSLVIFGADGFIIPSMVLILGVLALGYQKEKGRKKA
ncbi:MAG: AzlC family ABC transporter permease [Lachnospiraceae bacterium]